MKKRFLWLTVIISMWLAVSAVTAAGSSTGGKILYGTYEKQGQEVIISTAAWLLPGTTSGQERIFQTDLATGFETAEGFTANSNCAQNGWTKFVSSDDEGHIDIVSPSSGAQHARIDKDPSLDILTLTGCFSPDRGVQPVSPSTASIDVAISDTGGADYDVIVQAPSEEVITARVKFSYNGDIKVVDEVDGDLEFVDTGADWDVGPYRTLRINVNPNNNSTYYYYNGSLIYVGSIFAAATMEQIIFMSDNWQSQDHADFDNVVMGNGANVQVFLPAILTPAVPPAAAPLLNPIENPDGRNRYTVSWNEITWGTNYTLEESQHMDFANASVVYTGEGISTTVSVNEVGTYYYRVQTENTFGHSDWSNVVSTEVTQLATIPQVGYYAGTTPTVHFNVTDSQQVCDFYIRVPFGLGTCTITPVDCADIVNGAFAFSGSAVGAIFAISGDFDTDAFAVGDYSVSMCGSTISIPPESGSWDASLQ